MSSKLILLSGAVVVLSAAILAWASTSVPAPVSVNIATYYNSGSGFQSAWNSGGGAGSSPSSGSIVRVAAIYHDANGNPEVVGPTGCLSSTPCFAGPITVTLAGHFTATLGSSTYRSVEVSPAIAVGPALTTTSPLGLQNAYTLEMDVAQTPDNNTPITTAYQFAETNGIVFSAAKSNILYVDVRLASYSNSSTCGCDFFPFTLQGRVNDSRYVTFKVAGDSNTYSASLSSSNASTIVTLKKRASFAAGQVGITWTQSQPSDQSTYVSFYFSSSSISDSW